MKTHPFLFLVLLTAGIIRAQAQDNPAPTPAGEPAESEMQKWFATTDAQWQAAFKRDVTAMHEAELNKVRLQYLASLETAIAKASSAGDLDGTVALRNEQKRFGDTNVFIEQDEAGDAASVKQLRAAIRTQLVRVEKENAIRAKALHAKYDAVLAQAQTQLTQRQRIDDALLVKAKRAEVAAAWITPAVAAAAEKANPPAKAPITTPKVPFGTKAGPVMAKVQADDVTLKPFSKGEEHTGPPAKIEWASIPESLQGYQFTKAQNQEVALTFKVLSDGLVYMSCTTRFGLSLPEATSEEQLLKKGWKKHSDLEVRDYSSRQSGRQVWYIYSRECKAGEKFTYRTERYLAPVLLVK